MGVSPFRCSLTSLQRDSYIAALNYCVRNSSKKTDPDINIMEGQQPAPRTQKGLKKASQPHHVLPKGETGYTDNAAEECHDLIDRAEEEAHVSVSLQ